MAPTQGLSQNALGQGCCPKRDPQASLEGKEGSELPRCCSRRYHASTPIISCPAHIPRLKVDWVCLGIKSPSTGGPPAALALPRGVAGCSWGGGQALGPALPTLRSPLLNYPLPESEPGFRGPLAGWTLCPQPFPRACGGSITPTACRGRDNPASRPFCPQQGTRVGARERTPPPAGPTWPWLCPCPLGSLGLGPLS